MSFPTDHSKIAETMVFTFHSDEGHGWLAVKLPLIRELGLVKKITECSFMAKDTVYLEEDCDCPKFQLAFLDKFGFDAKIKQFNLNGKSPIRNFSRYKKDIIDE